MSATELQVIKHYNIDKLLTSHIIWQSDGQSYLTAVKLMSLYSATSPETRPGRCP